MWYNHLGLLLLTYPLGRWTWTGCNRAIIQIFILQGVGFTSHSENQTEKRKRTKKKKNKVRKRKAPIHNGFIDMGWYIIHGSVGQNILIQTPSFSSKRRKLLRACRASETTCERREFAGSNATAATTNGGRGGGEGEQGIGDESDGRRA
jgi:hypothetical protein